MKHRFEALDSWRGIAALIVALFHLIVASHFHEFEVIANGSLFVDFFFVLSGFVMTHAYMDPLQSRMSFGEFILRRIGRLWPLHMAILLVLVAKEAVVFFAASAGLVPAQPTFEGGTGVLQLIENVFFVQSIGIDQTHSWNGPAWSISTEFWAYVVFAVLCIALPKNTFTLAAALIAAAAATVVATYSPNYMTTSFEFGIFRCLYGFFVGHLTYRVFTAAPARNPRLGTALELAVVAIAGGFFYLATLGSAWTLLAPFVFATVVWVFAPEHGMVSRLLRKPMFLALGLWSYSIYMVHDFLAFSVLKFVNSCGAEGIEVSAIYRLTCRAVLPAEVFNNPWFLDLVSVMFLVLVISVSALTYKFVEVPGRSFFNRLASRYAQRRATKMMGSEV